VQPVLQQRMDQVSAVEGFLTGMWTGGEKREGEEREGEREREREKKKKEKDMKRR
jgi:hypothetical protein